MEWSKSTISKAELEKKQREYMEAAMKMAKKAGKPSAVTDEKPVTKAEIVEEIVEEVDDLSGLIEEIKEKTETEEKQPEEVIAEEISVEKVEDNDDKNEHFGVFNADELVTAIENGEVSGEGLKQAAEILEEMTRKTDTMRKLVEEQENEDEDIIDSGEEYGLNGFINRHNSNCRGCGYESGTQSP